MNSLFIISLYEPPKPQGGGSQCSKLKQNSILLCCLAPRAIDYHKSWI